MDGFVSRFFTFDKLIATGLIKVLYWIGLIAIALAMLGAVIAAFGDGFLNGVAGLVLAPIGAAVALVFWRFLCEVYIVVFGIYDRLGDIQTTLKKD
ncbi:MAG: DUF4282 domain-containing protein [Parvularculaceae bacterium]